MESHETCLTCSGHATIIFVATFCLIISSNTRHIVSSTKGSRALTDRQLIEAYAGKRDSLAFGEFVGRHERALLSFASAYLRDETLAQDVVQEAFLRAARDPHRLLKSQDNQSSGRNWLLKVVRDLSVDSLRKKATERRAMSGKAEIAETTSPAPDAMLEAQEQAKVARDAIDRLRPRLRELLILKVREGKSYKEIAGITGLTVTNVGFLLHQAMQELQKEVRGTRTEPRTSVSGHEGEEPGG